jgi:oxygen-independent coproporphyrinogen-3 oxidase
MRCPYCAFDILEEVRSPRTSDAEAAWLDGILADLARWRPAFEGDPSTLYVGGGTPSRIDPTHLVALRGQFGALEEATVEANPEDLDAAWLDAVTAGGFDRVSLGVQSMQPRFVRALGRARRDHDRGHGPAAMALLRDACRDGRLRSWSADLIFALPHQSMADLDADIEALLAFEPPHISIYGLTIEPGTPWAALERRRGLAVPDDDTWHDMYARIVERLGAAGLQRYEVSNFARPGHVARHNRGYWQLAPYVGLGPGAHGLTSDGRRFVNPSGAAWPGPPTVEHPDPEQRAIDALVSGLRGVEGLDPSVLHPFAVNGHILGQLVSAGLLHPASLAGRIRLDTAGFFVADAVVRALVQGLVQTNALDPSRPGEPVGNA